MIQGSVIYSKSNMDFSHAISLVTKNRFMFEDLYTTLRDLFKKNVENLVIMYYFTIVSFLQTKLEHCKELLNLSKTIYELKYRGKEYVVVDFYMTKFENLKRFVAQSQNKLPQI